jgi:RNA polymerase sigma-70 factor, ECF subfamily
VVPAHRVDHRGHDVRAINWTYVYDAHAQTLLRYLRRFTRRRDEAEDLLHDVFERAMSAAEAPDADAILPWLYRIASNTAISHLRRAAIRRLLPLSALREAVDPMADHDDLALVRLALRSIPPAHAVALVLVHHEGFARRDAARLLGVPEETLKTRLARGRVNFASAYARLQRGLRA